MSTNTGIKVCVLIQFSRTVITQGSMIYSLLGAGVEGEGVVGAAEMYDRQYNCYLEFYRWICAL